MLKIVIVDDVAEAVSTLAFGLSACGRKEGPVERGGKDVDKAVESARSGALFAGAHEEMAYIGENMGSSGPRPPVSDRCRVAGTLVTRR
jgi:hypothetical protein